MSINGVLNSAVSGLTASQVAMRTASTNIANVNTPGYARAEVRATPLSLAGMGVGVDVSDVRRIADSFLQRASLQAAADAAGAERAFAMLDRLQTEFGAMDDPGSLFGRIDASLAPLTQLAATPASAGDRAQAVSAVQSVLDEIARLSAETGRLRGEADMRIAEGVGQVNDLLAQIATLNADVQRGRLNGDASGAENAQAQLLDELAAMIDIRVMQKAGGGLEVRTEDGQLLVGHEAATLHYVRAGADSHIMLHPAANAAPVALTPHLKSGELAALIRVRDVELPAVAAELGELAAGYADALNGAHNAASAAPPPATLAGRNTGLLAGDALGFTGQASIGIVGAANGALAHRIDIDFDAGSLRLDGGADVAFGPPATIASFTAALNGAMAATGGSASFADGRLTLTAAAGEGLAVQQPDSGGASRGGRGFSHFFGLNDLVTGPRPAFFDTGLTGAEAHGFTAGQTLSFRVSGGAGGASDIAVAIGGTSINDVIAQLNNPVTGMGRYASFALDARGALVMTPAAGAENLRVDLMSDGTRRGATGVSFSQLFGLGSAARAGRAEILDVRSDIAANPMRLAVAAPDISGAALGGFVLGSGDGRGALKLHAALTGARDFSAAGGIAAGAMSVTDFAARLAGDVGARAARAERAQDSAQTLLGAVTEQRSSVEGVNLDEELANMTMYQQSYNASARLIQAAKEMMDALLGAI